MTRLESVVPVLPTADVVAALAHYATLGFATRPYEDGSGYGYVDRDDVAMHLSHHPGHGPLTTASQVYLYVADADALHEEWSRSGAAGRFHAPVDAPYGLREGAHVDPDGNLIRYGSWLPGHPS